MGASLDSRAKRFPDHVFSPPAGRLQSSTLCVPRSVYHRPRFLCVLFAILICVVLLMPGCQRFRRADTRPLDQAGMNYRSIAALLELRITDAEVLELAKAKQAGVSDQACMDLLRITRGRNQPLVTGDAVALLHRAGMNDASILELARLDQLGLWVGEVQAMRLAGITDPIILTLARRRAEGQTTLSGASLAQLKNAGMGEEALLEFARRGVTDNEVETIIALRRRGVSDFQILGRCVPR